MRTPNHLEVKEDCRQAIHQILQRHGLGEAQKVVFDDQGWVNVTAFVNDSMVIRFNARDIQLPKFQREKEAFKTLKSLLPVPELLVFDDSKFLIPYDYMICKKIEGENLESRWMALSEQDRYLLAYQSGELLAKIHSVTFNEFGEISKRGPFAKTQKWSEYLRFVLNYHLNEAMELKLFKVQTQKQFLTLFESSSALFDSLKTPKLLHGDFHFGNLLFSNRKITGVLDFEWSCAGDPLLDICSNLQDMDSKWPGSQEAFNKGYGLKSLTVEDQQKIKIYNMIKSIELCVVAKKYFPEHEAKEYVQTTETNF